MKKIFTLLLFVLGFSISVSAQNAETQKESQIKAKELALKVKEKLNIDQKTTASIYSIIIDKNSTFLNQNDLIEERKQFLINKYTKELKGVLGTEKFELFKNNYYSLFQEVLKRP